MDKEIYKKAVAAREAMVARDPAPNMRKGIIGPCLYDILFDDDRILPRSNTACHAGLQIIWNYGFNKSSPVAVVNHINDVSIIGENAVLTFYEWFLNYSPYASVFAEHDANIVMKEKATIADADAPCNLLASALMATRINNEYPNVGIMWYELVSRGVHPSVAFCFAFEWSTVDRTTVVHSSYGGHGAMNYHDDSFDDHIQAFLSPINKTKAGSPYKTTKTYKSIYALWQGKDRKGPTIRSILEPALAKAAQDKSSNNPFSQKKIVKAVTMEDGMDVIVPVLKETYKELVG